ncbi:PH domain-containing protein [Demequina aurantiaca]|uniref:PH domain-containing protein n=1 Tax=Demequina aurantiaca TaxID=676200 RepID=UPI000784958C|nr:PH domain-containing protein [Demequina aurantiaca]
MSWLNPDDAQWTYVSRRLIPARLISVWLAVLIFAVVLLALQAYAGGWWYIGAAVVLVAGLWSTWVAVRQVTAHAWAERDDDLVVKSGRMFRRVVVVPYGRMQYVEVQAGPMARMFGIARVQLHTASPGTDAHISGVPVAQAARLRDRLTTRGEAQLAGL